jgi:hypothetical protein
MIYLEDLFNQLAGAEFALVNTTKDGVINPKDYNRLITLANAASTTLHKRFRLKTNELILRISADNHRYILESSNAITKNVNGYIEDKDDYPFEDDIIEITSILSPLGRELILNNTREDIYPELGYSYGIEDCALSFHTPKYNMIRTPRGLMNCLVTVRYTATGKRIGKVDPAQGEDVLKDLYYEMPTVYSDAMIFYMASRLMNSKGGENIGQSMFHQGNNYNQRFENECQILAMQGYEADDMQTDVYKFERNGFA